MLGQCWTNASQFFSPPPPLQSKLYEKTSRVLNTVDRGKSTEQITFYFHHSGQLWHIEWQSCVWRTVSSQSSHHPQEVLLAQFSLYVHKGGLKPDSFHLYWMTAQPTLSLTNTYCLTEMLVQRQLRWPNILPRLGISYWLSGLLDTFFNSIYYLYSQINGEIIYYFSLNGFGGILDKHYNY